MGTFWETALQNYVKEYYSHPNDFLRQHYISFTTHPNIESLAINCYEVLKKDELFYKEIFPRLKEERIGNPYKFSLFPSCSPKTIMQLYQFKIIYDLLKIHLFKDVNHIFEIGSGYGSLCVLMRNLGFDKRFTMIDFPEMLDIQKDFIKRNELESDRNEFYKVKEVPNIKIEENSILYASFSINEMPLSDRKIIEPIYNKFKYIFIEHNSIFDKINNYDYFEEIGKVLKDKFNFKHFRNELRLKQKTWFMIGSKF